MAKKAASIPVKPMPQHFDKGIAVGKMSSGNAATLDDTDHSHRHDFHFFILQEAGKATIEIDFEDFQLRKSSLLYIHPSQVHLMKKVQKADLFLLAITSENIDGRYIRLLEEIAVAGPLVLKTADFSILVQAIQLSINIFERKSDALYAASLKDSCNTLIGLIVSQYLQRSGPAAEPSRFELVARRFRQALGVSFDKYKRPADYAGILNISVPYLNECVKSVTGLPVSHHIQQRVILEAKRMLVHSDKSVKEIAADLGYEDYPYFSRLFTKVAGMSALTFRSKNLD